MCTISVARVGWYPTADGIRPNKADTSEPIKTYQLKPIQHLLQTTKTY